MSRADQEEIFRMILGKIALAGACGFCAMDAAIAYLDGESIPKQVKDCKKECVEIVKEQLKEIAQ